MMSKYDLLWEHIKKEGSPEFRLTFEEIKNIAGVELDHSFLNYKKELIAYGCEVGKISLKEKTVQFKKLG